MTNIIYLKGDATTPNADGNKIIAHICDDVGKWGKGFVMALSARWKLPQNEYRQWYQNREQNDFELGRVQIIQVENDIWVCNMVAQRNIKLVNKIPPIRYEALEACLSFLAAHALERSASVHMPRIGCGLAGGNWELIEPLLSKALCLAGIPVFVYDFS